MKTKIVFIHDETGVECIVDDMFVGYFMNEWDAIVFLFLNKFFKVNVIRKSA